MLDGGKRAYADNQPMLVATTCGSRHDGSITIPWQFAFFPFKSAERTARGKGNVRTINPEWPKVGSIDSPVTLET